MAKAKKKPGIPKEDFIKFLSHATPSDINNYILEKGKPRKLIEPMVFFDKPEDNNSSE